MPQAPTLSPPADFDPARAQTFRFTAARIERPTATVTLHYALDDVVSFVETVAFPGVVWPADGPRQAVLDRLVGLLHLLAGVSYFKTAAPPAMAVETGSLSPRLGALLEDVYTLGLGEFAFRNRIDVRERGAFPPASPAAPPGAIALPATGRTLVPIGGGKDSVVALQVVQRAGRDAICFSVGRADPIRRCVAVAGLPHAVAERTVSPNVGALNAAGAHNGHVPVTAIVSTIAVMAAVLHGADAVAMANERSASEGNLVWDGLPVNHQWSKGVDFERAFRALLETEIVTGVDYRSVLRPAGELAIARTFSRLPQYHPHFTSCNAVFRIDPARRRSNWCGDCPKCRFVFLALAPWLDPPALTAIFGADLLDDPAQYDGFCDLAGLREHKPFECVGEEAESLLAMRLVAARDAWASHAVVRRLRDEQLADLPGDPAADAAPWRLSPDALAALPADLRDAVVATLAA